MLYFQQFPKIFYSLTDSTTDLQVVTNICARTKIRDLVLNDTTVFYLYDVKDGDTPSSIAYKYYGDAQRHWILLLVNLIINPWYDWPLNTTDFANFIITKYGSLNQAQTQIDHYQKIITKTDSSSGNTTTQTYTIDQTAFNALPAFTFQAFNLVNGTTVTYTIQTNTITSYQQEVANNEAKRTIKIVDKAYVGQIENELQSIFS